MINTKKLQVSETTDKKIYINLMLTSFHQQKKLNLKMYTPAVLIVYIISKENVRDKCSYVVTMKT